MTQHVDIETTRTAVLDDAHVGDIQGALGTIGCHDVGPRSGWWHRLKTLAAIVGPGLIVMVGDNDAGAFGTYTQPARTTAPRCSGHSFSSCRSST